MPDGKETVVLDFIYDDIELRDEPPYFEAYAGEEKHCLTFKLWINFTCAAASSSLPTDDRMLSPTPWWVLL